MYLCSSSFSKVPEYKPAAALAMLRSFLQGTKLPEYHASGPTSSLGGSRYEL